MHYSSVPNKRTCTPYLILTKLSPWPVRSYSGLQAYLFFWIFKDFCQIFSPNLEMFWEKIGILSKVSPIMNKIASFDPAL